MKLIYAFSSLLILASLAHGQIRIGGSDLLDPNFSSALIDYAEARDMDVTAHFVGSYPAIDALKKGELDLAIVAIPVGAELPGDGLRTVALASKVLAVIVPQANPINQISMRQLAAVFGEAESSNFTRWGQLGLTGDWSARSIGVGSISQSQHALALDLFRHQVLQSRNIKRNVAQMSDIAAIRRQFQQDTSGIALLHRVPTNSDGIKVLPIARADEDLAYGPTPERVASNEYPLRLPIYLVFPAEKAGHLKEMLRYIVSEEAAEALDASDLIALPSQQRQRLFLEFERL